MRPDTPDHAAQRRAFLDRLDAVGLSARRDALSAALKPAVALRTRAPTPADLASGASRVGGVPDLPPGLPWPVGEEGPLLFVLQVDLAAAAPFDLEGLLPPDGWLSVFTDRWVRDVRVLHLPRGAPLAPRPWAPTIRPPYAACGVDVAPELQPPPAGSLFLDALGLDGDEHDIYWDDVWLDWRDRWRPGPAGACGVHQLLGYAFAENLEEQALHEEVLVGFDSDDRADMQWGDVHCAWALLSRADLAARAFGALRPAM